MLNGQAGERLNFCMRSIPIAALGYAVLIFVAPAIFAGSLQDRAETRFAQPRFDFTGTYRYIVQARPSFVAGARVRAKHLVVSTTGSLAQSKAQRSRRIINPTSDVHGKSGKDALSIRRVRLHEAQPANSVASSGVKQARRTPPAVPAKTAEKPAAGKSRSRQLNRANRSALGYAQRKRTRTTRSSASRSANRYGVTFGMPDWAKKVFDSR